MRLGELALLRTEMVEIHRELRDVQEINDKIQDPELTSKLAELQIKIEALDLRIHRMSR